MRIDEIMSLEDVKKYLGELQFPDGVEGQACRCPEDLIERLEALETQEPKTLTKKEMNKVVRETVQKFLKDLIGE